jgi:hypothetical protein
MWAATGDTSFFFILSPSSPYLSLFLSFSLSLLIRNTFLD